MDWILVRVRSGTGFIGLVLLRQSTNVVRCTTDRCTFKLLGDIQARCGNMEGLFAYGIR